MKKKAMEIHSSENDDPLIFHASVCFPVKIRADDIAFVVFIDLIITGRRKFNKQSWRDCSWMMWQSTGSLSVI